MDNEIESLWLSLGIKPDDSSASDAVDKIIKAVQSKLKSSIYGGKNGVITLPATIEGKFKNGREINKSITDAYAAIYEKAKQMADESVSLTLKDIKDFKAQIDKFGKQTAKYRNNDAIANANNNLRQTVATYQNYINELKGEVAKTKKTQVKQTQKVKAKQKAKTQQKGETAYDDYLKKQEQYSKRAEGAGKRKELFNELDEVRKNKSPVKSSGNIRASSTNDYLMRLSEYSAYGSRWASELARTLKEEVAKSAKTLVTYIDPSYKKRTENGRATTEREFLNDTIKAAKKQLKNSIAQLEAGSEDITLDTLKEQAAVIKVLNKALGRTTEQAEKIITSAIEDRYNGNTEVAQGKGKYKYDKTTQTNIGGTNLEEGQIKGVGPGHDNTQKLVKELYTAMHQWDAEVIADTIAKEIILGNEKTINNRKRKSTTSQSDNKIMNVKTTPDYKTELAQLNGRTNEVFDAVNQTNKLTATQTSYDKIENASERVADATQETEQKATTAANKEEKDAISDDARTGFNTDNNAKELLSAQSDLKGIIGKEIKDTLTGILSALSELKSLDGLNPATKLQADSSMQPCCDALTKLVEIAQHIDVTTGNVLQGLISMGAKLPTSLPALVKGETVKDKPIEKEPIIDKTDYEKLHNEKLNREIERERNTAFVTGAVDKYRSERAEKLKKIEAANKLKEIQNSVKNSLEIPGAVDIGANAEKMSTMSREQLKKIRAKRVTTFGLVDVDQNPTATGDLSRVQRVKATYGWGKNQANPFKDLKLSEGIEIDTKAITEALQNALQDNMFNAQTGGWFKNLIGPPTLYLGQDSLEKSRAEADAVNTIMAKMRDAAIDILQKIQNTQLDLQGMKESGKAVFKEDGTLDTEASDKSAITLFANLEEQKLALKGVLADVDMVNEVVENTGGNLTKILQQLGFAAPELADCNKIIKNINSGLDKNGKALKFQKRTAEVLNYSFQLMARSIGQMIKNWIAMMNPLSLIKRAFQDFASYDVKWQRTMNVIKYNLRRIVKPMMEWIAQQIVNIIGLVNALMKGIGKAFGNNWDLFDKSAASAEQMREELEAASNVTASFDELHDIGTESSNSPPMDLMGDIYTPQWNDIYQNIENFGKKIGDVLTGIKKFTEGWNFWTWLAVIGGALIGLKVLKWLIDLFSGKNPLQSVADGFSFLEKAVGWALLIWAFTEFTKALTGFVECMKTADWEDIVKSLLMLGGAFVELVGSIMLLEWGSFGVDPKAMAGLAALVWVFGEFVKAIIPFIELMWSICDLNDEGKEFEILAGSLSMLALSFVELIAGVAGMEKLTQLIGLDWQSLLGLAAVVGAFDLFVKALVPFIGAISQIEGNKWDTIIPMIVGLGGAFIALAAGVAAVSKTFTAMDWKAIGQLYAVAGVFEVFMLALVPFLHAIKDLDFETLSGGTMLIAGAFLALGGALALMTPFLKMLDWSSLLEFVVIMGVMAGLIWVLQAFVNALKDLSTEQIYAGLILLAGGLMAITVAVGALLIILSAAIASGVGALAILALAGVLAVVALVIVSLAELVRALGEAGEGIKKICEGIEGVTRAIGEVIMGIITAVAEGIATVVTAIADGITNILTPILEFIDSVIGKITDLATTIVREIGETIRTVIQTTGEVIIGIIDSLVSAIPRLLDAILRFVREIGPAVETSCDAIMRTITKLINFVVSGIEYLVNTLVIDSINKAIATVTLGAFSNVFSHIEIARFVPKYEQGTNYVPNDGLAYLHQGEAVVPKKYNTPYQPDNSGMSSAIDRLAQQVARISSKVEQGIPVKGQFVQRGSDLVATVEKANNRMKNNILNNKVYAR